MAKHSISEAAKLTGKARSTLHRHINRGRLSKEFDAEGQPVIDTAELVRVYGPLHGQDSSNTVAVSQQATVQRDSPLQAKIEAMMEAQIDQLRADLNDARKERDDWKAQAQRLSGLLSDQRLIVPAASDPVSVPVPDPAPVLVPQEDTHAVLKIFGFEIRRKR